MGLAYLQLGWNALGLPLAAIYGGTLLTATAFLWLYSRGSQRLDSDRADSSLASAASLLVIYGLGTLLLRGAATPELDIPQIGLAVGTVGALLVWLVVGTTGVTALGGLWLWSGRGLLWLGWLLTVFTVPLQAGLVSALGLGLRGVQLIKTWRRSHLLAALALGLQIIWLIWRSLPESGTKAVIAIATAWTGTEANPSVLLGIAHLPYGILMVGLSDWLYRRCQPRLGQLTEKLAIALALFSLAVGSLDLTVLALCLIVITLTLLVVTLRRSPSPSILINATHALGLLAIAVAIADRWPDLPAGYWLLISLGFTWLEWGLSLGDRYQPWRRSAWYFGCVLAGLSYFNLLAALDRDLLSASWSVAGLASRSDLPSLPSVRPSVATAMSLACWPLALRCP
ncbi:MAG: hypothetical protein HC816_02550 [Leptolyngbyaceae cyanobacterium RM1_1_2]|nr:hypothetical protein [Leptolyngbyaceae cyanobacterium RM1_1_2]